MAWPKCEEAGRGGTLGIITLFAACGTLPAYDPSPQKLPVRLLSSLTALFSGLLSLQKSSPPYHSATRRPQVKIDLNP